MKIKPFAVEEWMNAWEVGAKYNIAGNMCGLHQYERAIRADRGR